jgi:hypothetical protein
MDPGAVTLRIRPMSQGRTIHVLPDRLGRWRVEREGDDAPLSEHENLTAAERAAAQEPASEVVVHDRYGRVRQMSALRDRRGTHSPAS